jgi:hypothetical protein
MARSRYLVQIVDRETQEVVQMEPGLQVEMEFLDDCVQKILGKGFQEISTAQADLLEACTAAILKRGVGLWRTEAHVAQDIRDGLREAFVSAQLDQRIAAFKAQAAHTIHEGIHEAVYALKSRVVP